jgi:hypothetical protein
VIQRFNQMHNHKFGVMCPCVLFLESARGPP